MLKLIINLFNCIVFFWLLQGCSSGDSAASTPTGKYEFVMFDSLNTMLLDGTLAIKHTDTVYTSEIIINQKYSDFYSFGNMKSGRIYTHYNKDAQIIFLNMNPSSMDDNIFITLTPSGNKLIGTWTHSTIAGEMGRGKFTAQKK